MTTYSELVTYFESLPNLVQGLAAARVGDDEAITELQASRIKYAMLWVETPSVRFVSPGDVPAKRFRFALVVLINEPKKTNAEANGKLSASLELLERIYAYILNDAETTDQFVLVLNDAESEPIRRWSGDNCYGWRMEIEIELERCECEC